MRNRFVKRVCSFIFLIVMLSLSVTLLSGCQSTDKSQSFFDNSTFTYTCHYDSQTDTTKIVWRATITNDTIYKINYCHFIFNLYDSNDNLLDTQQTNYEISIGNGKSYNSNYNFTANGNVSKISLDHWYGDFDNIWDTYQVWFIVMIVAAGIASIIYVIVMIVQDLELSDTFEAIVDFFEDHGWVAVCFLIPLAGTIWGIVTSYWVPILIVLGGIIAFVLLALIAHLIKFIVECIADNVGFSGGIGRHYDNTDDDEDYFDPDIENVADYIDDSDTQMLFSVDQLKEYCRENDIRGYSSLNKSNLVNLIVNQSSNETVEPTERKTKKTSAKISSNITFDDIAGLEEAKSAFKEKVVYAFEHKDLYEKYGKKVGGGLLLYGLPGTGKTMFAEAASNETDSLFIPIKCSDIKSKWYGESEANVKKIFEKARKAKKAIIFFDEFEAIGAKRTDNSENGNNDLVPQILAEMQGIGSSNANSIIMVIAATNKPWAIDSAFLRPGRFDEKIYIPLPDLEARKKLFELKLKTVPQDGLDFDYLASITDGFNGADIGAFCDKLKMLAINKSIAQNTECPITMDEVAQVQGSIKSSVSNEDVERLLEFKEQYR